MLNVLQLIHQICERIANLKGMPKYKQIVCSIEDKDEVIPSQGVCLEEKDRIIASKEEENQQLRQENDQAIAQLNERERELGQASQQLQQLQSENDQILRGKVILIEEKDRQLGHVIQQLEASKQAVAQLEIRIADLELREQQETKASGKGNWLAGFNLRWRIGKKAPCKVHRWCDAVVDGNMVYVVAGGSVKTYSYDITSDNWCQLPDCVHMNGSITVINGSLTAVGGGRYPYSDELFSLTGEGSRLRRWTKQFPPMPTKRKSTTTLCNGIALFVIGGISEDEKGLSVVEVMNTETRQWFTAANLPEPMYFASATVCGDQLCVLGGTMDSCYIKSMYACLMSDLFESCVRVIDKRTCEANIWGQLADVPLLGSTCESFHGRLLAIGGNYSGKATTAVYLYKSTTNCWEFISHMTTGRSCCLSAVLPDNRLMVVGGYINGLGKTDTMEFASVM